MVFTYKYTALISVLYHDVMFEKSYLFLMNLRLNCEPMNNGDDFERRKILYHPLPSVASVLIHSFSIYEIMQCEKRAYHVVLERDG